MIGVTEQMGMLLVLTLTIGKNQHILDRVLPLVADLFHHALSTI